MFHSAAQTCVRIKTCHCIERHVAAASCILHPSPPCLPRHTLPVSVEKKKTEKKNKKTLKNWMKKWDLSVGVSEHWSLYVEMISFFFFLLSFCLGMILTLFLNTERIYALFWLVVCVRRNRKLVAVTNTMMTQRLFHVSSFFCTFWSVLFCFYGVILTRRATLWRRVAVNTSDNSTAACTMSWWWCHIFI